MRRTWVALGGALVAMAVPATAQAWEIDRLEGVQYRMTQGGFDGVESRIKDVADAWGRKVSFLEIFDEAEQATRALDGDPVPGAVTGFRWDSNNENEGDWRPQGITGSADAQPDGMWGPNKVLITSWHHEGSGPQTARITLHKTTDGNAGAPYRHVLLVIPRAGGQIDLVESHAGGLAWVGKHLYVASTNHLRVFNVDDIIKVRAGRRDELPGKYNYILPQSGSYDAPANDNLRFSSVSVDRSRDQPALVTSEFIENAPNGRIVRWPLGAGGLMGQQVDSLGVWRARGINNIQGALMKNGRFALSTSWSDNDSFLYVGAPNQTTDRDPIHWERDGLQDLFYAPERDRLYSLTEFEGSRRVFAVDASSVGL